MAGFREQFYARLPQQLREIEEALSEHDTEAARSLLHKLYGSSTFFSDAAFIADLAAVQEATRQKNIKAAQTLIAALIAQRPHSDASLLKTATSSQ
jgi:HPt (histidine-containing phosphotransfer) domain-containing protein